MRYNIKYIAVQEDIMAKKENKKPAKPEKVKGKKGKDKNSKGAANPSMSSGATANGVPSAGRASVPLAAMSPDQMTAAQLEQAIKESNNPESRLKKLRSPVNVRSCLLNILFLIIMTLAIVMIWCAVAVDKFNFVVVVKDMSSQFGITQGFQWLFAQIRSWF